MLEFVFLFVRWFGNVHRRHLLPSSTQQSSISSSDFPVPAKMGSYSNERTIGAAHNNYPSGMNETEASIANHLPQAAATNCDQKKMSSALSASKMTQNGSVEMSFSARLFETKPDLWIRVRTIGLIGALLPGIGCYICIAYTYLFQLEQVQNFTSTNCENVRR